jgi:dTDP-4-dehydrorhamnose 3,5-epimerase
VEGLIYYDEPHRFVDDRGFFQEVFNGPRMGQSSDDCGTLPLSMVQMNHSRSVKGVLRGLHWQKPNPVGKFVTCLHGRILDVVVDIRQSSPTFKEWKAYELDSERGQRLWVPEGFAHGFVVISPIADVLYLQSAPFDSAGDRVLRWNDPAIGIDWPVMLNKFIISEKDKSAPLLSELPGDALFD